MAKSTKPSSGFIYRPWIRLKDGTILYAKSYGKKVFKIPISDPKDDNPKS